ncbi:hypothetical protein ABIC63_005797 [Pseudacidovorax sp. 1753]|uniref:M91 family zinc metallopeptidase n=1 Tax=Pseudacidovorax sp. 1753 TaxID=3156419 RepID=UPI003397061D
MTEFYSSGIQIKGGRIRNNVPAALSGAKAKDFVDTTRRTLDAIKATGMGRQLLNEINASGHVVKIYRTWDIEEGPYQGGEDVDPSMVVPLDEVVGGELELHRVLERACEDLSGRSRVKKFLGIGRARPRFIGRDAVARLVGVSPSVLKQMEEGKKSIDPNTDAKLRVYLYDFLTPGPGSDCLIAFNHKKLNYSEGHMKHLPMSKSPLHLPLPVVLAHELTHAWRVMTGRVLFLYGWEEEAMTVGLPPFSSMKFTENRFRIEFDNTGLAIRPEYAYLDFNTGIIDPKGAGIDQDKKWQGKSSAIEPRVKDVLKGAMEKRRAAMGYDGDDDDF